MELDKKLHMEKQSVYGYCFRLTRNVSKEIFILLQKMFSPLETADICRV